MRMKNAKSIVSAMFLCAALPAGAHDLSTALDPVAESPEMYTVILENEFVQVIEYEIGPGQRDNWHTHPAKVSYVVNPGQLRITTDTGESFDAEEIQGSARWLGEVGKHYGENTGTIPVRIVFVEVKGAQDRGNNLKQFSDQQD
jgi:quercetin dioxygenase-like cupin family protein